MELTPHDVKGVDAEDSSRAACGSVSHTLHMLPIMLIIGHRNPYTIHYTTLNTSLLILKRRWLALVIAKTTSKSEDFLF